MNLNQFLAELAHRGVKLWAEGDQLRFRAPKGVLTPEARDLLALHKTELVKLLHQSNANQRDANLPLVRVERDRDLPLSFAQARVWFLSQLEPNNPFYNELQALRFHGFLNVVALEKSFNKIIARHEALRTNFVKVDGQPVQVIAESLTLSVPVVDLRDIPSSEREISAQRLAIAEAQQPFDLASSPLIRTCVLKLTEVEHVLLLTIHHIVFDGWSWGILLRELATLYCAFCNDLSPELLELSIQYADFAVWQRQWLQGEVLESQLAYWKQQLEGAPEVLELPTDRVRPSTQTYRGAHHKFVLSKELTLALVSLSQESGVTLFMTLLAAFQTFLARYTGQTDICVGTPHANRSRPEIDSLIGFFVNTLVLRTCLSGNPSFEDVLSRVRDVTLLAHAHQDLPFEKLVEELKLQRDLSYTPLVQVMLVLNGPMPKIQMAGLTVSPLPIETTTAKFDLTLSFENTASGLIGDWEYNTDLFDASTITRMARHFQTLLEGIVTTPQQKVSQLPLLTEQDRHQLLVEWNNTTKEYPQDKCIHQLFEAQVKRSPDAIAVVFEDKQLTYRELNQRANRIAHHLKTLGVGPEVLVGICVERSLYMVVGLLGILKAGGAYVPLDPSYPTERLALMLEDTEVSVLLTEALQQQKMLPQHRARIVCLDSNWSEIARLSEENPTGEVTPDNLAYVMYTSGSTGKPKGVSIIHRSVVRLVKETNYANFSVEEVFLQLAPISFDASTFEIWGSLLNGGRLVVMPPHTPSLQELGQALGQYQVTTLWLTAGLFHLMVDSQLESLKNVRQLLAGGDVLSVPHIKKVLQELKGCILINGYGPTENTTFTCCHKITDPTQLGNSASIGRPIANTQVYLLDEKLQLVPIGVSGELYIGGDGLARGYLNRPDLTYEKFIPNPFNNQPGSRLYKTGDKARYLPDGNIEFLGRFDNQVKIRGFRIELGEIETAIAFHPAVRETVVVTREDVPDRKYLAAYIVPNHSGAIASNDLRGFLKEKLPDYMIPGAFVMLDVLPLTPNGKVDRRALPAPEFQLELQGSLVASSTPIEEMLASIWADVLRIKLVGVHHNFFELGGHSLLATQVILRVRDTFAVELPLRSLFEAPTIAELASRVELALKNGQSQETLPLLPIPRSGSIPLSFAQARLWFLDQLQSNSAFYNIPFALRLSGQLNIAALETSINEIIRRHEALRTNFTTIEGQPSQIIASTLNFKLLVVDLLHLPESLREIEAQRLAFEEANRPFNLEQAPLLRGMVLQLGETEYVLLLTMHHIISDGWSLGVLVRELTELYKAFCTGSPPSLPDLPVQYADFAIWQRQWLTGEILSTQLNYWKEQLKNAPDLLELPTDRPRPAVQTFRGGSYYAALSLELRAELTALGKRTGVTLFMTLIAAFQTLLYRLSGQDDIVVGTPFAGRNRREIEGLIGFFVNTIVLRTDLKGNPTFEQLLNRVREVALQAYAHQDLPFEQLVEALQPTRDLSYTPLFQVMFDLNDAWVPSVKLPELTVSEYAVEIATTKFDLTLSMSNTTDGLVGEWEYNADLFDETTIARMAGHFQTLLEALVANPQQRVSALPLLTESERHQLLVEWNNTTKEYPSDKCIHQLFEEQVERSPDAIAVVFEEEQLTYRELNQRANRIAHHLKTLGVGPEVLVGICVERSLEMIVGLLGILKAGGAYVPLDPTYPSERLHYMLEDSGVQVLLTQARLVKSLPKHNARVVCLDTSDRAIALLSESNPISGVAPDHLAYVIYTSGSTGVPKGVKVNHSNIVRLFEATSSWFHVDSQDVWTLFHSIAFDFSVWELWGALIYGGRLVVVPYLVSRDSQAFLELLCQEKVTVLNQTPSAFRQLIKAEESKAIAPDLKLRLVIFGGEALELKSLKPWFERYGDCTPQLVNMYGITETTVHVTYRPLTIDDINAQASVIGRTIPDLQVYLLDQHQQLVPIGVPGEMYIGGAGVARGYLNRPELTAQRFISNPFSDNSEALLYKSGDLARYLPNGELEYLGRIDQQVKIRGFRIELGEIEALLAQHPAVRESVVLVRSDEPAEKRLVAYVVSKVEQSLKAGELRRFLKEKLPEYMVPAAFVQMEALPLTANGKVDRRGLPAPDTTRPELEQAYQAPSTPAQKLLADIWAQVLGLEQVGIHDNFFALGGDSIRSIQVQSLAHKHGLSFSVQQLFQHQTIHELAQKLKPTEISTALAESLQPFSLICEADRQRLPDDVEDAYPVTALQMGMFFHSEFSPDSAVYHNITSLHIKASFDLEKLQAAVQKLAARHPVLRTSFELSNFSKPLQLVHQAVHVPLQVEDLCHLSHAEQEDTLAAWFEAEKSRKFDWRHAPLLRFQIHRRSEETFQFSVTEHHAILDGWSVASMITELLGRYLSLLDEQIDSILPPISIGFRDFVALEQQALASEECQRYWMEKFNNSTFTKLPRWPSISRETNVQQVGVQDVPLSPEICEGLKQLALSAQVPLKSVLLAAHLRVLSLLGGQSDVLTGLVANGRPEQTDGERVLGLFLNTLPFRLQVSGGTWIDLVRSVFEAERELLPYRRYPLAEIQRNLDGQPLFETAFNFVHFHVYQQVLGLKNLQLLGEKFFGETNFTFLANFSLEPHSSQIELGFEYNASQLCPQQINRISGYYIKALVAMVNDPQGRYELLSLLSFEEEHQLLVEWNSNQADYSKDLCIHELFEAQVERSPDAIAVVFEEALLTYRELNTRANQLAHYLQTLGVGPEVPVGICVERSLEMVVGLLGILKAGGAYMPLDPTYPLERLRYMLENSSVYVLLTQQQLVESLPHHQAHVVCLDIDWEVIARQSEENLTSGVMSKNQAYVIYTSGSTGFPKGVAMSHSPLSNLILWQLENSTLPQGAKTLQFTPLSFDVSFQEIFSTWCAGGMLVLISEEVRRDPVQLLGFLKLKAIARLFLPFVALQQLASVADRSEAVPTDLREVITAGEQLQITRQIVDWFIKLNNCTLYNQYGPSESHVVTAFTLTGSPSDWPALPPIGGPITNTQIYLLDAQLQPVPIGVYGELYIGGIALARGYLNNADLTISRFIPHPYSDKGGSRLYKTGDYARYLPDGNIEFLGRIDNQVKIRGFRIELGEIEAAIAQYPAVHQTTVMVREDIPGDKYLAAYIVPNQHSVISSITLRDFLKRKLPSYMVPGAFVMLSALPLTPNGKVDRKALPTPQTTGQELEALKVAPRTKSEQILAKIWCEVLHLKQVGIHDNFFELGGHSIKATQIMLQLREAFKIELPLRHLFEKPTVAELAATIAATRQNSATIAANTQSDLNAEAVLDTTIQPRTVPFTYTSEPKSIFLTGATGFLGAYLLYELLEQTQADVYCLLRAANEKQAKQKLLRQMELSKICQDGFSSRIIPIVGDLSKKFLDISASQFRELANQIDIIYHNGAWVNHIYPYSTLKPANVLGTQEILRFASEIKLKPVHYISTIGVFSSPAYSEMKIVSESDTLKYSKDINNGYAESKWVAEKLVMQARDRGLPVCIYRPVRILGSSQTGICNTDDFLCKFIIGNIQLGIAPKLDNWAENIIPVDYMSRAIIHISRQKESLGKAFHLVNPNPTPMNELFNWIRALGYPLEEVPYKEWRAHLIRTNQVSSNEVLQSLLPIFSEDNIEIDKKSLEFDFTNALSGLAGTDIVFPPIERGLIEKYLSDFIIRGLVPKRTGFLQQMLD